MTDLLAVGPVFDDDGWQGKRRERQRVKGADEQFQQELTPLGTRHRQAPVLQKEHKPTNSLAMTSIHSRAVQVC